MVARKNSLHRNQLTLFSKIVLSLPIFVMSCDVFVAWMMLLLKYPDKPGYPLTEMSVLLSICFMVILIVLSVMTI